MGQKVVIRYPNAIRPWQHVLEPVSGYISLAENLYENGAAYSGAWNFGPNDSDAQTVGWIVDQMATLWGKDAGWEQETLLQPHEANYLKLDCSKARSQLKWQPKLGVKTALTWVVDWMKSLQSGANMRDVTVHQISQFIDFK